MAYAGLRGSIAIALALALLATVPSIAAALSSTRARQIALRILAPERQVGDVVVFGLAHALGSSDTVFPVVSGSGEIRLPRKGNGPLVRERPIGQRAWLFWEDLAHGARFQHPSRLLLLSDRSGRVLRNQAYNWWPLIDGRDPPFIGAGYNSPHYQVFSGARTSHGASDAVDRSALTFGHALGRWNPFASSAAAPPGAIQLPAGAFDGECIITIGLKRDPQFAQDFNGINAAAAQFRAYGLKGAFAPPPVTDGHGHILADPDGKALQQEVTDAITKQDCTDIMIYIDGHGYPAPGTKYSNGKSVDAADASPHAQVLVGYRWIPAGHDPQGNQLYHKTTQTLDSTDLKAILLAHPTTGFKFKIDSCFSGRFIDDLPRSQYPNLVVLETAANNHEYSWSYLKDAWVKNGLPVDENTPGATHYVNTTNNPGNTNAQGLGRGEFTNGNLSGFNNFITNAQRIALAQSQGGSLLGHMLADAFITGSTDDFAQTIGILHPQFEANLPGVNGGGGGTGGTGGTGPTVGTARGSLTNGSGSVLAYSVQTNEPSNAFEIILPSGINVTSISTPPGFNSADRGNTEILFGGSIMPDTSVTGSFDHTGTIAANCGCVQVQFSMDGGLTWFPAPAATLTGPASDSPPTGGGTGSPLGASILNPTGNATFLDGPLSGGPTEMLTFQGQISGGSSPYSATINWGDGSTSTGSNGSHAYPGTTSLSDGKTPYSLSFNVSDSAGHTASASTTMTVLCAGISKAGFTADLGAGSIPTIVFCGHWTGGFVPAKVLYMPGSGQSWQFSSAFNLFENTQNCPNPMPTVIGACGPKGTSANPTLHFGGAFNINASAVLSGMKIVVEGEDTMGNVVQTFTGTVP